MVLFGSGKAQYYVEVDPAAKNSPHAELIRLVGIGKDVLEVGSGMGHVTKVLKSLGNRVTCVELREDLAAIAQKYCNRMIVGDIEEINLCEVINRERFDVVTFGDVLEHLRDPVAVLRKVRPFLKAGGYVVASIPNIAHRSVRYALLLGEFNYEDEGLLDRTHLRFFTRMTIEDMFKESSYQIVDVVRIRNNSFLDHKIRHGISFSRRLSREVLKLCLKVGLRGEALTYQFVMKAVPTQN